MPSGTKWACCNVGASKPEDYGGYYSWGETETKSIYRSGTYSYGNDNDLESYQNLGNNIAGSKYDVAFMKWGGSWRMPSLDQIDELLDNCSHEWLRIDGVNGYLVTGQNGHSIFLPATGQHWSDELKKNGEQGYYWSSSVYPKYVWKAYIYTLVLIGLVGYEFFFWGTCLRMFCSACLSVIPVLAFVINVKRVCLKPNYLTFDTPHFLRFDIIDLPIILRKGIFSNGDG